VVVVRWSENRSDDGEACGSGNGGETVGREGRCHVGRVGLLVEGVGRFVGRGLQLFVRLGCLAAGEVGLSRVFECRLLVLLIGVGCC